MKPKGLSLYHFDGCPYCGRVRDAMARLDLEIELRDIHTHPNFRSELVAATGKQMVPCLRIEQASGVRVLHGEQKVWRVSSGGWFIVDEVVGKHEFITYAVGLDANGSVKQIEVMDYRETYGGEIRNENWRVQFVGKTNQSPLKLDRDIKNISGATLSCRHVTDGVKRLLAFYEIALKRS